MRIINLEDNAIKHSAIQRVLRDMRITDITWVENVEDGLEAIENAIKENNPFDLAITDMQYPLCKGADIDRQAGDVFINRIAEKNIDIPIIICSSDNLRYDNILGCVWYIDSNYWERELSDLVRRVK